MRSLEELSRTELATVGREYMLMVQAVNPRARCAPATPSGAERLAWEIVVDASAAEAELPPEAAMVAATTTAAFAFRDG